MNNGAASSVAASLCEAQRFICGPSSRVAHRATATVCLLGALAFLPAAFAVEPLEEIVEQKKQEIARMRKRPATAEHLRWAVKTHGQRRDFAV